MFKTVSHIILKRTVAIPGIYKIVNTNNNKFYLGSTNNLYARRAQHWSKLSKGKHVNIHLQRAFNLQPEAWLFLVVEVLDVERLIIQEQFYLDTSNPDYNFRKVAESNRGMSLSKEHRKKISEGINKANVRLGRIQKKKLPRTRESLMESLQKAISKAALVHSIPVICTTTGKIYKSITEAAIDTGEGETTISRSITQNRLTRTKLKFDYVIPC